MKKNILIILLILIFVQNLHAQVYNTYDMPLLTIFESGSGEGKIRLAWVPTDNSPQTIAFDQEGHLYITDPMGEKTVRYNRQYQYVNEIRDSGLSWMKKLIIDNNGLFNGFRMGSLGIYKQNGECKLFVSSTGSPYKTKIDDFSTFVYYNDIVFVNLLDGGIIAVKDPGPDYKQNLTKIVSGDEVRKLIEGRDDIRIDEKNRIFINGVYKTTEFRKYLAYWKEYYSARGKSYDYHLNNFTYDFMWNDLGVLDFLGEDINNNWYWGGINKILVFNKDGLLVDAFFYDINKTYATPAVHPSGDIFFLHSDYFDLKKGRIYIYTIKNTWDPAARAKWYAEHGGEYNSASLRRAVVLGDNLRIRSSDSLSAEVLGTLKKDEIVEVLERGSNTQKIDNLESFWFKVKTAAGITGWVFGGYLQMR